MEDLKLWIYQKIPAINNFEFEIENLGAGEAILRVPLIAHLNHKGTAFGGSLYNSAVLACYLLVHSEFKNENVASDSFVISDGSMKYLKPVNHDFLVTVNWSKSQREDVLKTLNSKSKARWNLKASITVGEILCAEFNGRFVLNQILS
jgi:thioesterase domain-containing protein